MEKRHAMVVKATGKVARIPAKEVDADHTETCELVEVGPEVEAGMWRQRDGSFGPEQDKSYHSKPEAKAKRERGDEASWKNATQWAKKARKV